MARRRPRQIRPDAAGERAVFVRDGLPLFDPDAYDHPRMLDRARAWALDAAPDEPPERLAWIAYTKTDEYAAAVADMWERLRLHHERS